MSELEHLDALIVGAGLSGVDAAYWLKTKSAARRLAIFEARDTIGGTWDLFRYPGVRSDSDMATLGFPFRPWRGRSIVGGTEICDYIRDTAREFGIDRNVRLRHRVIAADWSTVNAHWIVSFEAHGQVHRLTCNFLFVCAGYFDYDQGYAPTWPAMEEFSGQIVHPQFWPQDLSVVGKRVVVIGSGATAITLIPALAEQGTEHVTMLQRSPTYIVSKPALDELANKLRRRLPRAIADAAVRWKAIGYGIMIYYLARKKPDRFKRWIAAEQERVIGSDFDIGRHLTPRYNPWDQRLCVAPDGDLFHMLRDGRASIATEQIERFTSKGIKLQSGEQLAADIVVTATGLNMKLMGGAELSIDGAIVEPGSRLLYKGAMLSGVPNLAFALGYTNASWTLKSDLTSQFVSRLLNYMATRRLDSAVPIAPAGATGDEPMLDLKSGYVQRAAGFFPRQGKQAPWKVYQNYLQDLLALRTGKIEDGVLRFGRRAVDTPEKVA